jgi:hypothetical protein
VAAAREIKKSWRLRAKSKSRGGCARNQKVVAAAREIKKSWRLRAKSKNASGPPPANRSGLRVAGTIGSRQKD